MNNSGQFVKGSTSYWKGKKLSLEHRSKLSQSHKGVQAGEKHPLWKGEESSYQTKHDWVKRRLGRPRKCENCGTETALVYDWANLSGMYLKDLSDWARLCRGCHRLIDDSVRKMWATRRAAQCV